MTTDIRCSFCAATLRELSARHGTMIAGPSPIYICSECVVLCTEIMQERAKAGAGADAVVKVIGDQVNIIASMAKELEELRASARPMEYAIKSIAQTVAHVLPRKITCLWCEAPLADDAAAKEHVGSCEKHPAVIALREARARAGRRRSR